MKTILKTSEIIVRLKQILKTKSLDISYISDLDISRFHRVYVLMVHYGDVYQALSITLRYGWIELEFGEVGTDFEAIRYCYWSFLTEIPFTLMKKDCNNEL